MPSPINFDIRVANGADLGPFKLQNLFNKCFTKLTNDTDTVQVNLPHDCYLSCGPLRARYKFQGMHFHWGSTDADSSEHSIQGQRFGLEAHLLFKYDYKFKAPLEILEANKKLTDLKWKVDHPDEEEEEEDTDDEFVEEEEEETEEELMERYLRDSQNYETLEKTKMEEWAEKRCRLILKDAGREENEANLKGLIKVDEKKLKWERIEKEDADALNETWRKYRHNVEMDSNMKLREIEWATLKKNFLLSQEAKDIKKLRVSEKFIHQLNDKEVPEQKNATKALKLELDAMSHMESMALEQAKEQYTKWIQVEDQLDKKLKRELRNNFEAYLEEIEEREELEDDGDIPEEEKKKMRIRWTIQDNKKEEAMREKLKNVLDRRTKELDEICTKNITSMVAMALLFKIDDDAPMYNLFSYIPNIYSPWKQTYVDGNLLAQWESALTSGAYFTYTGSLTMRPFTENINWICLRDPLPIQSSQVGILRNLQCEYGKIESNNRDIQSVGDRQVYYNKKVVVVKEPPCPGKEICQCSMTEVKKTLPTII